MAEQGTFRMVKVERDYGEQECRCSVPGCQEPVTHRATLLTVGDPGAVTHVEGHCYRHSAELVRRMVRREWDCSYPSALEA